jgi:hypothetical protein
LRVLIDRDRKTRAVFATRERSEARFARAVAGRVAANAIGAAPCCANATAGFLAEVAGGFIAGGALRELELTNPCE